MMKHKIAAIFIFAAGAAIGAMTAWRCAKKKYERIAQEEIDSVKAAFSGQQPKTAENMPDKFPNRFAEYEETLQTCGYRHNHKTKEEKETVMTMPYVISPNALGEIESYEIISLTYYADGVLTDDNDDPIDDIEDIVGVDSLKHFGEYEDDSVFVRNDRLKCDFEVLLDQRTYDEMITANPYKVKT